MKITLEVPDPDSARDRLIQDLIDHNPFKQPENPTLEERLELLEHHHREHWTLMLAIIDDNLATALDLEDRRQREEAQHRQDLPLIEDKESFVSYVSMVTRLLKQGTITAVEARALLYGAQLTFAAIREGGGYVQQTPRALP